MFMLLTILIAGIQFNGSEASTDKGALDGLRPGDQGRVYYLLQANQREVRIDSTSAVVQSCRDESCSLVLDQPLEPSAGYWIEVELPDERLSVTGLAEQARQRLGEQDFAAVEQLLPRLRDSGETGRTVADQIQAELSAQRTRQQTRQRHSQLLEEADSSLRERKLSAFSSLFGRLASDPLTPPDKVRAWRNRFDEIRGERMVRIEAGAYSIGEDAGSARFYNQSPRFRKELKAFWIDRWPVTRPEFASKAEFVPAAGGSQTSVTFADAETHCRALGKRLPSEFEWEVAAASRQISDTGLSEWTSSWYLPYPGNQHAEQEFGESFRVLRGGGSGEDRSPLLRFFMNPEDRQPEVAFRCASDDIQR